MTSTGPGGPSDSATATVETDLPCAACGYNLRTLSWSSKCPECGRPVQHSAPLRGFRFHSLRSIRRARLGLGLLVCVFLWYGLFDIVLTLTFRFIFDLPRAWSLTIVRIWMHEELVVRAAILVTVILLTRPFAKRYERHGSGLGLTAVFLALLSWLGCAYASVERTLDPQAASLLTWGAIAWEVGGLCGMVALALLWVHLLRGIDRGRERALWWTMCLTVAVPALILCGTAIGFIRIVPVLVRQTVSGISYDFDGPFWSVSYDIWRWWQDEGQAALFMAMLLPLWLFVRRMNAAVRAREKGCAGPLTSSLAAPRAH